MFEFNIYINANEAVLVLEQDHLNSETMLHIYNDENNPAKTLFLQLPIIEVDSTSTLTHWFSNINLQSGQLPELIVLINSPTHIHSNVFNGFDHILISDQKVLEKDTKEVKLDGNETYNARLIIDNFYTKEGYIFCNYLSLIGKGEISEILGVKLKGDNSRLDLIGEELQKLNIAKLYIISPITEVNLDKVFIKKKFGLEEVRKLSIRDSVAHSDWDLENIEDLQELSLKTASPFTKFYTKQAKITSLLTKGKFYIAANSYINFDFKPTSRFSGVELVIDMSESMLEERKVTFPNYAFAFDKITVINASDLLIPLGGVCGQLILQECSSVKISKLKSAEVYYSINNKAGYLSCNGEISNNLFIFGKVTAQLSHLKVKNIEAYGLCDLNLTDGSRCESIMLNLNVDASNLQGSIQPHEARLALNNKSSQAIEIGLIVAKLSTFSISGKVKLGTILIQSIDGLDTLLWARLRSQEKIELDRLFIFNDHDITIIPGGGIQIAKNQIKDSFMVGETFISATANTKEFFHVSAANGIRFHGLIESAQDIGFFSKYSNIFTIGHLKAANNLMLSASHGSINSFGCSTEARAVMLYSNIDTYLSGTVIKAQEIISYTLGHYVQSQLSHLSADHIVCIAEKNIKLNKGDVSASQSLIIKSGNNAVIQDSDICTGSLYLKSVHTLLMANSGIKLSDYSHVLFVDDININQNLLQFGFKVASDVIIIGVLSEEKQDLSINLQWEKVNFESNEIIVPGKAYIEANKGYIVGSSITADKMHVIIKTTHSLEVVPLVLYNEVIAHGGLNMDSIKLVASKINAGLIDIDAGRLGIFVSSLLKATTGSVAADILGVLLHPKDKIEKQQERIRVLKEGWDTTMLPSLSNLTIDEYFNFSQSTSISQRIGNLVFTNEFGSKNLSFTMREGDVLMDHSWTSKYDKLVLNLEKGKLLIQSKHLQDIYKAGGDTSDVRTVIGGNHVFIIADVVRLEGAKVAVTGDLKIVTRDGVHILPIAVHQRLEHYHGSKTRIIEASVHQVISEINAGYFDIKAGTSVDIISALIRATGVKIEAQDFNLGAAKDIFEKHVYFRGAKPTYGARQKWEDHVRNEVVIPTQIHTNSMFADITHDTTIEAANIFVKGDSAIKTGHDLNILHKYNVHVHDHASKKTSMFSWNGGLKINSTKSVREHLYGEEVIPTIYYTEGSFFGIADGRIHMLGAKIVANKDIYLIGKQGVRLEAAPYHQDQFVSISETGVRSGFTVKSGEISANAELFKDATKTQIKQKLYEATEVISKGRLVIEADEKSGVVEIISSKLRFEIATIKAKDMVIGTHKEAVEKTSEHLSATVGMKIGVLESITPAINRAGSLINKKGDHWIDNVDRLLNAYQVGKDTLMLGRDIRTLLDQGSNTDFSKINCVKAGIWASGTISKDTSDTTITRAVDNDIKGGSIDIILEGKALIEGIICEVKSFYLKARDATIRASSDTLTQDTAHMEIKIDIPISGYIPANASVGGQESTKNATMYHTNNRISVSGKLEVYLDGDGKISGVKLQGAEVGVRAQNLVLESLQDVIEERMRGMSLNIGLTGNTLPGLGVNVQSGYRDAAWTNALGSIIGTEITKVVVQQTLEIAGGLIANAEVNDDGMLTDKGNMSVKAGSIIARHLKDYDDGVSFGVGLSLSKSVDSEGNGKWGTTIPVSYSFHERSRDILPVIGKGALEVGTLMGELSRDVGAHIGETSGDKASMKAEIPVSDIVDFVKEAIKPEPASEKVQGLGLGVAAGDVVEEDDDASDDDEEEVEEVKLENTKQNERLMVGGNNDPVEGLLANPIWNLLLTVARGVVAYQESHKDSKQRNERDWQDVVREFENEHNQYVSTLNEGDSNIFVKYGYRSMDMIGIVGRTTIEGARDTLAMVPDARAYLNAFVSGAGYVIGEGIREGTPRLVLEGIGNAHESYLGLFQTENQKWTADLGLGIFLPPAVGKVLQVTKTGANMLLRTAETKVKLWDVKGAGASAKEIVPKGHFLNKAEVFEPGVNLPALIDPAIQHPPIVKVFDVQNPNLAFEIEKIVTEVQHSHGKIYENFGSPKQFTTDIADTFGKEVKLFHGKLQEDMWVINFHDGTTKLINAADGVRHTGKGRTLAWQTSMTEGTSYKSFEEMLDRLALQYPAWGERNAFTVSKIPKGEVVTYVEGKAGMQKMEMPPIDGMEAIKTFKGKGHQVKFLNFDGRWIEEYNIPLPEVMKTPGSKKK